MKMQVRSKNARWRKEHVVLLLQEQWITESAPTETEMNHVHSQFVTAYYLHLP